MKMAEPRYEFVMISRRNDRGNMRTQSTSQGSIPIEYHQIIDNARKSHEEAIRLGNRATETWIFID
jgi:hypothetical protein